MRIRSVAKTTTKSIKNMPKPFTLAPPIDTERMRKTLDNLCAKLDVAESWDARGAVSEVDKAMKDLTRLSGNLLSQALVHYEQTQELAMCQNHQKEHSLMVMHNVAKKLNSKSVEWQEFFNIVITNMDDAYTLFTSSPEARAGAAIYSTLKIRKSELMIIPEATPEMADELFLFCVSKKVLMPILNH